MKYRNIQIGEIIPADAEVLCDGKWQNYYALVGVSHDFLDRNLGLSPENLRAPIHEDKPVYRPRLQLLAVTVALSYLAGIAILVFWGKW